MLTPSGHTTVAPTTPQKDNSWLFDGSLFLLSWCSLFCLPDFSIVTYYLMMIVRNPWPSFSYPSHT